MKRLLLACVLLTAACGPQGNSAEVGPVSASTASAAAGPTRLDTLKADASDAHCTNDGVWCATSDADATTFVFSFRHQRVATFQLTDGGHEIWPQIIRMSLSNGGEIASVGITHSDQQAYSGGGGQATTVTLYTLSSTPSSVTPKAALTFPSSAAIDIRACFSEADTRARRGACSDQYNFTGTLSLDTSMTPAKLVLVTEATTYPAGVSRNEDNTHALSVRDLRTVRDRTCSYRRVFTWDAATQTYKADAPLPACSDYLEP